MLNVFGPRNVAEIERILTGDGIVLVATAAPDHLRELRPLVGAIGVDPRKRERLDAALSSVSAAIDSRQHRITDSLARRCGRGYRAKARRPRRAAR